MTKGNVWDRAQSVSVEVSDAIEPGFNYCFDSKIPKETKHELHSFIRWLETEYRFPITLYIDFEYKHYLVTRKGKRVGYLFYWADFDSYPVFDNPDDVPMIRLPVCTARSTIEEILSSLIEAVADYYAWLCNEPIQEPVLDVNDEEEILQKYLSARDSGEWRFIG
ncbi:MAG: hypothetical protein II049_07025 [Clostridia bacterium]|nr:hypothetical protein [Clostridia bacterium]